MEGKDKKLTKYEDIDPEFEWKEEESHDTLQLHVEGFRKEQLRVQLHSNGSILVSGERPPNDLMKLNGSRFQKEFKLSKEDNFSDGVTANLRHGVLRIKVPKKTKSITTNHREESVAEKRSIDRRKKTVLVSAAVVLVGLGAYLWLSYKYSVSLPKVHNSMSNQTMLDASLLPS